MKEMVPRLYIGTTRAASARRQHGRVEVFIPKPEAALNSVRLPAGYDGHSTVLSLAMVGS
jgi:hypothetical protein